MFNILNKISPLLNLNLSARNTATYFYRKIIKAEKEAGKKIINNITLLTFCVFYAIRQENHNAPITVDEVVKAFNSFGHRVSARLILRDGITYRNHIRKETYHHKSEDYLIRLIDAITKYKHLKKRLMKKGCLWSIFEYRNKLTEISRRVLKGLSQWERRGRNPFIMAGAVIYLADKLLAQKFMIKPILTQQIISVQTSIAEYSIRDHYVNVLKPLNLQLKD